jgi:MATE family multidrug resistance protein
LANSFFNIVSYFVIGAASAIDTLVSQAFGRGDTIDCQKWMLRALLVFSLASIPCCCLLASAGQLFKACNFNANMAETASAYLLRLIPGTPFFILFVCMQKYQQAMNKMLPSLSTMGVCTGMNLVATAWAVNTGDLACLAWVLTAIRVLLCCIMTVVLFRTSPEWQSGFFERGVASQLWNWKPLSRFLELAWSGAFMTGLEAMAFEITVFGAAGIGKTELDAHNILLQLINFFYLTVPLGISIAATIRTGNLLGSGAADKAKLSALLCITVGSTFMLISAAGLFLQRKSLGLAFTADPDVVQLVARIAPVAACFQFIDGFQGVSQGVLRAMGKQAFLAKSIFVAFWVLALPLGFSLCFIVQWGIVGMWIGLAVGLGLMAGAFGYRIFVTTDWSHEAMVASSDDGLRHGSTG